VEGTLPLRVRGTVLKQMDSFAFNETSGHVSILLKVTAVLQHHRLFFGQLAITERP
jgi:hypothetical protein